MRSPSRSAVSWMLLLGSAGALVATSQARWEVRDRIEGDTFALGSAPVRRRVLLVLNPAGVAGARREHRSVEFTVDVTAMTSGSSPPAKIHVRVVAADPPAQPSQSSDRVDTRASAEVDCVHRACAQAFDVLFEAFAPPAPNGSTQVLWSVTSEASVLGSSAAPRGAALTTRIVAAP